MGAACDEPLSSDEFTVAVSHDASHALLEATGALDLAGVRVLDEAIGAAERAGYGSMIVLDLGGVTSCNAAGFGVLVSWHYARRAAGAALVLTHPSSPVRRRLAVDNVHQLDVRGAPGA
jgi:anti-anti-sigma factor